MVAFMRMDKCEVSERKEKAEEKIVKKEIADANKELVAEIERAEEIAQDYKDYFLVPQLSDEFENVIEYRQKIIEMDLAVQRANSDIKIDEAVYIPDCGFTYNLIKRYKKIYQLAKSVTDYINDDIIYADLGYELPDEDSPEPYEINVPKVNYVPVEQELDEDDDEYSGKKKKKKKKSSKKDNKKSKKKKKSSKKPKYEEPDYEEDDDFDPYSASVDELEEYLEFDVHEKVPDIIAGKSVSMAGFVDRRRDEPDAYQMNEWEEFNGMVDNFLEELAQNEEVFSMFAGKLQSLTETIRKLITLKILYVLIDDRVDKLIKKYMTKLATIRANARYDRKVVY